MGSYIMVLGFVHEDVMGFVNGDVMTDGVDRRRCKINADKKIDRPIDQSQ